MSPQEIPMPYDPRTESYGRFKLFKMAPELSKQKFDRLQLPIQTPQSNRAWACCYRP